MRSFLFFILFLFTGAAHAAPEVKARVEPCANGGEYPVHLSFDDGPKLPETEIVLNILKKQGIKATFFISASHFPGLLKGRPSAKEKELMALIDRMKREGHQIGSHSYEHIEHATLAHESKERVHENIRKNWKVIEALGLKPPIPFRFPYGDGWFMDTNSDDRVQAEAAMDEVKRLGFVPMHWDVDTWDWSKIKRKALPSSMLRQICSHHGGIVLMHDIHSWTAENLPAIIKSIQQSGHHFVSGPEFSQLNAGLSGEERFVSLENRAAGLYTCDRPVGDLDQVWRSCTDYKQHSTDVDRAIGVK